MGYPLTNDDGLPLFAAPKKDSDTTEDGLPIFSPESDNTQKKNPSGNGLSQPSQSQSQSQSVNKAPQQPQAQTGIPMADMSQVQAAISKKNQEISDKPEEGKAVYTAIAKRDKLDNSLTQMATRNVSQTVKNLKALGENPNEQQLVENEKKRLKGLVNDGKLVPVEQGNGDFGFKQGETDFGKSFTNALTQSHQQDLENNYLFNLPKDEAISYLNRIKNNPETGIVQEQQTQGTGLGKLGEFLGENANMLMKGTIGAEAGAAAPFTGGESFGTFLAMSKDLAQGGYSQTLKQNYYALKQQHPEMSDNEAFDKAQNIAFGGEAANLATGAILSKATTAKLPESTIKPTGILNGIQHSAEHAIKSAPKVIGTSAATTAATDLIGETQGVKKNLDEVLGDVGDNAKNMAVMHFGLWGLSEPTRIPSYIRPQIENYVASAPRQEVADFYSKAESEGIVPEGTSAKVASKLAQFDEQKKVVDDLPIPEENKAAIAGKLIQKQKLQEQKKALAGHGEAFKSRIDELDKLIEENDVAIDQLYNAKNVFQVEQRKQEMMQHDRDQQVTDAQERLKLPTQPDLYLSDDAQNVMDKIDKGENILNSDLDLLSNELYGRYKTLAQAKNDLNRNYTREQYDKAIEDVGNKIDVLENHKNEQAEADDFIKVDKNKFNNIKPKDNGLQLQEEKETEVTNPATNAAATTGSETTAEGAGKIEPTTVGNADVSEHAEDVNTAQGKENGIKPTRLTDEGKAEAKDLGRYIKENNQTDIVTSDVGRAKETADIAGKESGAKVETNPLLRTWNIGEFDGKKEGSFDEKAWTEKPTEAPKGGESFNDFKGRMVDAYKYVNDLPESTHVVTHSKVMRAFDALKETDGKWTDETTKKFLENKEQPTETNEGVGEGNKEENVNILKDNTWYRGVNSNNKNQGDRFFSTDESIAHDYAIDKVGDKPTMTQLDESEHPKNPLIIGSKEDLADEIGYDKNRLFDLGNDFDKKAKEYAQSKGHDAIIYQSGSFDEPEMHLFEKQPTNTENKNIAAQPTEGKVSDVVRENRTEPQTEQVPTEKVKEAITNLTPEQKKEYIQARLDGKGDEYLKGLNKPKISAADKSNEVLSSGDKADVEDYVNKARTVLSELYPKAKLEVYTDPKEYEKAGGDFGSRGLAIMDKNGEHRILLNLQEIRDSNSPKTAFHEVIHPIVYDAIGLKPHELVPLWNSIADAMQDVKGMDNVFRHIQWYSGDKIAAEGITETLAQIAAGNIDISSVPKSTAAKIVDLINQLFEKLGINIKLSSPNDFNKLAQNIKDAFQSGKTEGLKDAIKNANIDKFITEQEKKQKASDVSVETYRQRVQQLRDDGFTDDEIREGLQERGLSDKAINDIFSPKTEANAIQEQSAGGVLQHPQEGVGKEGSERERMESGEQGQETAGTRSEEKQQQEEVDENGGRLVGASHRSLNKLATDLGLPKPERGQVLSPEEYTKRGEYLINNGADPQAVADEFERTGKVNAEMISVAKGHLVNLVRDAENARKEFGIRSDKYKNAIKKVQDWSTDVMKPMGTKFGEVGRALQGDTDMDTGNFVSVQRAFQEYHNKDMSPQQQQEAERLTNQVAQLSKQVDDLKNKVTDALDRATKAEEIANKKTYTEKAKKVADNFRKLKTKPFKFTDENGNEHDINIQGVTWNDLVELGAKAIEKTGEIADGVAEILDKLKDVDWYKKLSDKDKYALEKQLEQHYKNAIEETPEAKNIRRLEKQLDDLRNGKIPQTKDKRELSDREKDLQDQIFEEKKNLGLIKSKVSKPEEKETPEQKNIKRMQEQLDELKATGKVKEGKEQRELTDDEKFLKQQIQDEKDNIKFKELQQRFADKRDNKFSTQDAKDIWDYAKKAYIDKGASYGDMINGAAVDLGLTPDQVGAALTSPKGVREITDEMYRKQNERNKASQYVEDWVKGQGQSKIVKFLKGIPRFFFGLKVFGHGTVGFITHAGVNLFDPVEWKRYFPNFLNQFKYAYGDTANYERAMENLQKDPQYIFWKRAGLAVDPTERYDDYQFVTKIFNKMGAVGKWLTAGDRGFNALKVYRLERAKALYSQLSDVEKADPETPKQIAKLVNHSTGTSHIPLPEGINVVFFAPRLEASRWDKLIVDPARAAKTITNWKNASAAEKVQAKIVAARAGRILGTYAAALAVNQALLSLSGSNQKVNFTDPTQSDFMKFKIGDRTLDLTGGMISVFDFISRLVDSGIKPKDEVRKSRTDEVTNNVWYYATGKLSPFGGTVKDLLTHHDYAGNTLPFSNDKPLHSYNKQLTWKEYLEQQQTPIPVAETFNDLHKQMEAQGVQKATAQQILGSLFVGALVGGTGMKIGEESPSKANPTFTKEDKADPTFKYYLDKGVELPNTSPQSEKIKDKTTHTVRSLSDYPKETQDAYKNQHKENLKEKLETIKERGYVYISPYGEISISPPRSPKEGLKHLELDKIKDKEQWQQILHLAQSSATTQTKKDIFGTD